jgi:hypothetical protein
VIELELDDDNKKAAEDAECAQICKNWLTRYHHEESIADTFDDCINACRAHLLPSSFALMINDINKTKEKSKTAWRIDGTLREFAKFDPVNCWFDYPIHTIDTTGILKKMDADDGINSKKSPWKTNFSKKKTPAQKKKDVDQSLESAFGSYAQNEICTIKDIAEYLGVTEKTAATKVKYSSNFKLNGDEVERKI